MRGSGMVGRARGAASPTNVDGMVAYIHCDTWDMQGVTFEDRQTQRYCGLMTDR
jgi:hypothetical protein